MQYFSFWDVILTPIYLGIIYYIANNRKKNKIEEHPEYEYYTKSLFAKIFGSLAVYLIYAFYFGGGDTNNYTESCIALSKVIFKDPAAWFSILRGNLDFYGWTAFDKTTGWPEYFKDPHSFAVVRLTSLLVFFSFRSQAVIAVLVACVTFPGTWKLFQLFNEHFPQYRKQMAIGILFIPSLVFWGSAVLKDSYCFAALSMFLYCFYRLFVTYGFFKAGRKRIFRYSFGIFISCYVLLEMKPYIFLAMFTSLIIMFGYNRLVRIKSNFMRFLGFPIIAGVLIVLSSFILNLLGEKLGKNYGSVDGLITKASITQDDLKTRERYGDNTFDIGEFDQSISGVLKKAVPAIIAGIYRPVIFECTSVIMMLSGLENAALVVLTLYILVLLLKFTLKNGIRSLPGILLGNPLMALSIVFTISFAFSVGLTAANFGALVRYKIPLLPFFVCYLLIIYNRCKESLEENKN